MDATARRVLPALCHIDSWIFDLDLTLYAPEHAIMAQIRDRIAAYVQDYFQVDAEEGHRIRRDYWQRYGTTLNGLMAEHGIHPHSYLERVHDVDLSLLTPCDDLHRSIVALPGRKLIFTNADAPYAARILAARGLETVFDGLFDIHDMQHQPKPHPPSYAAFCAAYGVDPKRALFIEDTAHNLQPAKTMGMTTVWVDHEAGDAATPVYVDYRVRDLTAWLTTLKETA